MNRLDEIADELKKEYGFSDILLSQLRRYFLSYASDAIMDSDIQKEVFNELSIIGE